MKEEALKIELHELYKKLSKDSIGDDFVLVNDISTVPFFNHPYKVEVAVATICLKGSIKGTNNLRDFFLSERSISIVLPGQIVEYQHASEDFSALFMIMSKRFAEALQLNINNSVSVFLRLKESPIVKLNDEEFDLLLDYYDLLLKVVRMTKNPHRLEMVSRLSEAFFYVTINLEQLQKEATIQKSRKEQQFESFYNAVLKHYKESREVIFYADKLCITPKYLSNIIRSITGKSANDWINEYVTLEAKSMLRSTNLTIQEISEQLGFPNQSFFGKYFKQHTGMPPKEYRNK